TIRRDVESGSSVGVGRREEDERRQVLRDVVEAVLGLGRDVDDGAGLDRMVLVVHGERGAAGDDVVDLVLLVGPLLVDGALLERVHAEAQALDPEELAPLLARLRLVRDELRKTDGLRRRLARGARAPSGRR